MSKESNQPYSEYSETILALVTNLAMTKYKSRTPKVLAKDLALKHPEVAYVLKTFKGLFRESKGKSKYGENYYWLQLRYARWWLEDNENQDDPEPKEPLEAEYLNTLLTYISGMVEQEQMSLRQESSNRSAAFIAWLAAGVSIVTVVANLILNFIPKQ